MGKHNKDKRKEYLKRRKRKLKDKRTKMQYTEESDCTEEDQSSCSSLPEENNSVHYREESDCTEEDQTSCGSVSEKNNSSVEDNGSDSGDSFMNHCLDLNDPKVIKMFAQPKPSEDPLYVSFYRYQRNKRKLLKLLRNPLQYA